VAIFALWIIASFVRGAPSLRAEAVQSATSPVGALVANRRPFAFGVVLLVSFAAVFYYILTPSFGNGKNGLMYADDAFNSLSKGSAYFIPQEAKKVQAYGERNVDLSLRARDREEATTWARLYGVAGANTEITDQVVRVRGSLGRIVETALADCDAAYHNQAKSIQERYGLEPRAALHAWYQSFRRMDEALTRQGHFDEASTLKTVMFKALEPAYNYYGTEIKHVRNDVPTVASLLTFYLLYTVWYGAAIYFLCEGIGLSTSRPRRKAEV